MIDIIQKKTNDVNYDNSAKINVGSNVSTASEDQF